jgi:hypothetical protein
VVMTKSLETIEPLRERIRAYVFLFWIGLGIAGIAGLILWAATPIGFFNAVGYANLGVGTLLLLAGGARGGGYTNLGLGAVEAVVGGRNRIDDDYVADPELRRGRFMSRRDPMERLRKGLRPPANPSAFWQTVAGFLYVAVGVVLTQLGS